MNDKKGSRNVRINRNKKRKFPGNRYTMENETEFTSTSAKKLCTKKDIDVTVSPSFTYCILDFVSVFTALSSVVICKECKSEITFNQSSIRGLGFKISMECQCDESQLINSCPMIKNAYSINRRIIFVMRLLGIGYERVNLFCGLMDLCQDIGKSTYHACLENIHIAASAVYESTLSLAIKQEKKLNEEAGRSENEFTVSSNGMWEKRGFSSLFGVSALIGKYSNKVVDACVSSSFCDECDLWKSKKNDDPIGYEEWYTTHRDDCTINHSGSTGKMEIDAIDKMFMRSVEKYDVKYVTYIDESKTLEEISNFEPYGSEHPVIKKECVEHAEDRMRTRLLNAKETNKQIGDKEPEKLTDKLIGDLTKYYGLAIRRRPNSIDEMKREIWATFYHKCSTDDNPQHDNCPPGENSWCAWRKAEAEGRLNSFHHDEETISKMMQKMIKPIYEDLTKEDVLTRCLGAETRNNKSLNSIISTFMPRHLYSGPKIVEIATFLAVIMFNEGFQAILKIMTTFGCKIGQNAHNYSHHRDETRIDRSSKLMKRQSIGVSDFYEEEEGLYYEPSIADRWWVKFSSCNMYILELSNAMNKTAGIVLAVTFRFLNKCVCWEHYNSECNKYFGMKKFLVIA